MTIAIKVNSGEGLAAYLADYQANFSASGWGGFNSWNPMATSGSQYAQGEGSVFNAGDTSKRGFVAEGALEYTLFSAPAHTLYGQLDSLSLGHGLSGVSDRTLNSEEFTISGLNLSADQAAGRDGVVHKVLYGLMKPNNAVDGNQGVQHLIDVLDAQQLDVSGGAGDDLLHGYSQNDTLSGGAGNDTFEFGLLNGAGSFGNDTITDYHSGDVIRLAGVDQTGSSVSNGNLTISTTGGTITVNGVTDVNDVSIISA